MTNQTAKMDLWMCGDDERVVCEQHVSPEMRAALADRPVNGFQFRTPTEGVWTRITATTAVLDRLTCEVCGAAPTDAGLGDEPAAWLPVYPALPQWERVPFPPNWIDETAWPWIVQYERWVALESGTGYDLLFESEARRSFRADEDGTIIYFDDLNRFRIDLVTSPGYGCWVRFLSVPVLPGHPGSVQREEIKQAFPAQGGPGDPATIIRTLYHLATSISTVGFEDTRPVGAADLTPEGPFDVLHVDGQVLAAGQSTAAAEAVLREVAGAEGTVHVARGTMKAYAPLPDPSGGRWHDHGHGELVAYVEPSAAP